KSMIVSACFVGTITAMIYLNKEEYSSTPSHSVAIKPSFIPKASPVSIDQFIADYDEMFDQLTAMKIDQK
ncbi:MAG: hypothetical protein KJO03_11290, partial [Gammaproteobacteria bacterium]|nr:hypothetical protein [Gammaproteobacteria bacterium]